MPATTVSEYTAAQPEAVQPICAELERVLNAALERATGTIWHGHPVWMIGKTPVAGFKASSKFVTFMIWRGQEIDAPLSPTGSFSMAVAKPASVDAIDADAYTGWLRSAEALES